MMEPVLRRDPVPVPLNCIKCGRPMMFHSERYEPDEQGCPDHVRIYFCRMHGFFHFGDRTQIAPGM